MNEIYVIEYKYPLENGVWGSKINSDGFTDLDKAREWCGRNGAIPNENKMMYKWIENGDNAYIIHPITIKDVI